MKHLKKVIALVLTLVTALAMATPAFAEDAAPKYDYPLTVTGLSTGDTVQFYQVVQWVGETSDKSDVSGWKAVDAYKDILTKDVLTAMLVGNPKADPAVAPTGMTSEIAGKLAAAASGGVDATKIEGDTATFNNASSGMWMALVTPKDANTIYNPVFVSADYNKETGHTGTAAVTGKFADGVAKSSTVTVTKTAANASDYNSDNAKTTAVGDIVTYTVKTTIPGYGNVYEHPHFVVSDSLSNLELVSKSVTITKPSGATATIAEESNGYTITFGEAYLKTLKAATEVEITYQAKVTSTAAKAVNEEDNEVKVEYSHNPNQQSDYDVKKDTTQHYTFSIDAAGAGEGQTVSGKKTSEVVKIGVDASGNPINETTETSEITSTEKWNGPLEGAVFGLWKSDNSDCTGEPFKQTTTTADGRMNFAGLDAGTYYLKEISAPAGYVTDTTKHTVVIAAETESVKVTEWWNGTEWVSTKPTSGTAKEVTYDTDILKSYTVTIDSQKTAEYTFTNQATANSTDIKWEEAKLVEKPFQLSNTKGTELPSTGGMGTKILYTIGGIMVVAGGVFLAAKKRMNTIQE